jgi:hypothetical protein
MGQAGRSRRNDRVEWQVTRGAINVLEMRIGVRRAVASVPPRALDPP